MLLFSEGILNMSVKVGVVVIKGVHGVLRSVCFCLRFLNEASWREFLQPGDPCVLCVLML